MASVASWAFLTDKSIQVNSPEDLEGYTFDPKPTYSNVSFRDGNDDGKLGSTSAGTSHTNDGVAVGEYVYNVSHHWSYTVKITYADGTTFDASVMAMRLIDDPDHSGSGPYHGKLLFRFRDEQIDAILEGSDGPGGKTYPLKKIASIKITDYIGAANSRAYPDIMDDPYPLVCFTAGTLIDAEQGPVPVEDLQPGDRVLTVDHGLQPLRWIGARKLDRATLKEKAHLRPIRIKAGAISPGLPNTDLYVSPQHRILISSKVAKRMFGQQELLIPVKKLLAVPGIEVDPSMAPVIYYHFLLDTHEVVFSNGLPSESLYMGPMALKGLGEEGVREIVTLFPEVASPGFTAPRARYFPERGQQIASFVSRHLKNSQPLIMAG